MKSSSKNSWVNRLAIIGLVLLLVLMPFHAFLSISLGHIFGHQALFQSWKEVVFILLAGLWLYNCWVQRKILFRLDVVNCSVLFIISLGLLLSFLHRPSLNGFLFGFKTDLVPLGLFLVAQAYSEAFDDNRLTRLILLPALVVSILAILQVTVVPSQILALVGYSSQTINPLQLIDMSTSLARAFSTLGGPNQLGTYLILPAAVALVSLFKTKKLVYLPTLLFLLAAIGLSFSRSAWIGTVLALLIAAILAIGQKFRLWLLAGIVLLAVLGALVVAPKLSDSNNVLLQNLFLHGQFFSNKTIGPPDVARTSALENGFTLVKSQPWGHGLGTAGPASYHNDTQLITEDWYLQIGYELGLIGLLAYLVFFVSLIVSLVRQKSSTIQISLIAGLVGILAANVFLHSWADSTLAIVVFITLGLFRGRSK